MLRYIRYLCAALLLFLSMKGIGVLWPTLVGGGLFYKILFYVPLCLIPILLILFTEDPEDL